jgi:hypothetical protein
MSTEKIRSVLAEDLFGKIFLHNEIAWFFPVDVLNRLVFFSFCSLLYTESLFSFVSFIAAVVVGMGKAAAFGLVLSRQRINTLLAGIIDDTIFNQVKCCKWNKFPTHKPFYSHRENLWEQLFGQETCAAS